MLKYWLGKKAKHADFVVHHVFVIHNLMYVVCVILHAMLFIAYYSVVPIYQVSALIININEKLKLMFSLLWIVKLSSIKLSDNVHEEEII